MEQMPHQTRGFFPAMMAIVASLPALLQAATPAFQIGACGVYAFPWIYHYQPIDFAVKLALEDGVLGDIIPNTSFITNLTQVHTGCYRESAAQPSLELFLGKGTQSGRISSTTEDQPPVIAIQGCVCGGSTDVVSNLASQFKVPVVSGFATAAELSDKTKHPYLLRSIPPDVAQTKGTAELIGMLGWKRFAFVYEYNWVEGEEYMQALKARFEVGSFVAKYGEVVVIPHMMPPTVRYVYDTADYDLPNRTFAEPSMAELAALRPQLRVFMLSGSIANLRAFQCFLAEIGLMGPEMQLLGTTRSCDDGMLLYRDALADSGLPNFEENMVKHDLVRCINGFGEIGWKDWAGMLCLAPQDTGDLLYSPAFAEFWTGLSCDRMRAVGMPAWRCEDFVFQDISFLERIQYLTLQFDAMLAIHVAIGTMLANGEPIEDIRGERLLDTVKHVSFAGLSGDVAFDEKGDRLAQYKIMNMRPNATGWFKLLQIGLANLATDDYRFDMEPVFRDGTTTAPADRPDPCPEGWDYVDVWTGCQPCPLGTFSPGVDMACLPCTGGTFRNDLAALTCSVCPAGHYCPKGTAEPQQCGLGNFCGYGESEPQACGEGRYMDSLNGTSCHECRIGTYSNASGRSTCSSCGAVIPGSTTLHIGRADPDDCVCGQGMYLARPAAGADGACSPCLDGLLCEGGLGPPLQLPGIHAGAPAFPGAPPPFRVHCASEAICPGGELGSCPEGSTGLACDRCEVGFTREGASCVPCAGGSAYQQGGLILSLCLAAVACLYVMKSRPTSPFLSSKYNAVATCTLTLFAVQAFSGFGQASLMWLEPMRSISKAVAFVAFDFEEVKPTCMFGFNEAWKSYLASVLGFPAMAIALLGLFALGRLAKRPIVPAHVMNAECTLMMALYLPLALVAKNPLFCVPNPDGSSSMLTKRSVLCWDSEDHQTMVFLSAFVIGTYLIPFMALCAWSTMVVHRMLASDRGHRFFEATQFLFHNFRSDRHWFGLVFLFRKLSVALVPVLVSSYPKLQMCLLGTVFVVALALTAFWGPWRSTVVNLLDSLVAGLLIVILLGCSGEIKLTEEETDIIAYYTGNLFVDFAVVAAVLFAANALFLLGRQRDFAVFISHSGRSSTGLARWTKMELTRQMPAGSLVFLASDSPCSADEMLSIIRGHTRNFLLLLTEGTLSFTRTAMEFSCAALSSASITFLSYDSCDVPAAEYAMKLMHFASSSAEMAAIAPTGLNWNHIDAAYAKLAKIKQVRIGSAGDSKQAHAEALAAVRSACTGLEVVLPFPALRAGLLGLGGAFGASRTASRTAASATAATGSVVILGDLGNSEVWCSADVLRQLLSVRLPATKVEMCARDAEAIKGSLSGATCMLVILSCGLFQDPISACAVATASKMADLEKVLVATQETFVFPSKSAASSLASSVPGFSAEEVFEACAELLKQPTTNFRVSDSMRVMDIQVDQVAKMASAERVATAADFHVSDSEQAVVDVPVAGSEQAVVDVPVADSEQAVADVYVTERLKSALLV